MLFGYKSVDSNDKQTKVVETAATADPVMAGGVSVETTPTGAATKVEPNVTYNVATKLSSPETGQIIPLSEVKDEVLIYNFSPIVAGLVMGAFWQVFVIFGVHWGFVAVMMANLASQGFDPILGLSLAASFAQTGVVLGILLQTKNQKTRGIALPAIIR
ncbi:hypothetical protein WP50_24570 [Lactiplantibacillus plantarum]|nr:hypothetical protein WP50_24570 [Lactiplantibacillus plantarum]